MEKLSVSITNKEIIQLALPISVALFIPQANFFTNNIFMGMLGEQFPKTQFFITGVLGPHANAHGPNEFLHIDYTKKLTACVSLVLADHAKTLSSS